MSKHLKLPTLLVVAENPSIRLWVKKHLDSQFFVIAAESREEAIDALNASLDFIIIDSALEEENVFDLCKELSKRTQKILIPILLITGRLKRSYREQALEAGVTDFLSDQLDVEELETRIATGLKAASVRQKTEDLSLAMQIPKIAPNTPLKQKVLLNDPALQRIAKEKSPIALLFLRIDSLEDREDPSAIFSQCAQLLAPLVGEKDLLLPFSEESFILLLPNSSFESGRALAEKIQKNLAVTQESSFTVSIAVSCFQASKKTLDTMIRLSEKALQAHPNKTDWLLCLNEEGKDHAP